MGWDGMEMEMEMEIDDGLGTEEFRESMRANLIN